MEWDATVVFVTAGALLLSWYLRKRCLTPLSQLPLPPGPKGLPFIGNLLDMPTSFEWKTYHKWAKEFDTDILSLNVAGTSIIVLDTAEAVTELFERRSSAYSNRSRMPMINELMGWDFNFGFMQYGERWRRHRRLMHHNFHPAAASRYRPYSLRAARNLLNRFLDFPQDVLGNLRQMAGETIISVAYGLQVQPMDDPYIKTAELGVRGLVTAAVPGTFLVDMLPFLKYVPEWMPGAGFKKKAREWKKWAQDMVEVPYMAAKENIATGIAPPSVASLCLQKMDEGITDNAYAEDVIQGTIGTLYTAGTDTTVAAVASCILGMLDKPEVLEKAQRELDRVVKRGHLPDFQDQDNLPYITAIVMEALRWRDVAPIALPRYLDNDDEYKGYRLPAGSIVIANSWSMLHDEEVYPDPFTFNPDRFMKDGVLDKSARNPSHACWGFGRRICPGRYMAFSSIWIAVASLIAAFDIKKAVDEEGSVIEPCHECSSGLIAFPKPFKCSITPRSTEAEKMIRSVENMDILIS